MTAQKAGLAKGMLSELPVSALNEGKACCTKSMENEKAIKTINTDSTKNCAINWLRCEPIAFLTPTSLARFAERAVDKFIKLMHAINNTNIPILPNIYT